LNAFAIIIRQFKLVFRYKIDREADRQIDTPTGKKKERQAQTQADRKTEEQTNRQTCWLTPRQT